MGILLQVSDLSKEYSGQKIFSNLSFTVAEKQKIGVIGKNGSGKSTLFRILNGEEKADEGSIIIGKKAHIGYLKQQETFKKGESALEYLKNSGAEEWEIRKVASKFQIDEEKLNQEADGLSGGWRMRLKLTEMLLKKPNLFLLDEPTNYLDLTTLLLLEKYLNSYSSSFMIISHDREFLKRTCQETIEISSSGCYHYPGGIEDYLVFKEQKLSSEVKANKSIESQQEHLKDFVDRFRYKSSKAKQAQSYLKKIKKLEEKRITIESKAGITRIVIPNVVKRKNFALRTRDLSIGYGDKVVVGDININIRAGERIAFLGMNGQGKTTFLRTITDFLEPIAGSYRWSKDTKIAYHGPDPIEKLDPKEQILDYLTRLATAKHTTESILKMASDFLFRDHDLKKRIGVLSGGERSRLLLAGILLSNPDIFLLDEPTCHLDFETVEALADALKKFNGTVLFTSHDRTFTSLVATGLVELKNGQAKMKLESYEDYIEKLREELYLSIESKSVKQKKTTEAKEAERKRRERMKQANRLEKQLEKLNKKQLELVEYFYENPTDPKQEKVEELSLVKEKITEKEDEWLNLSS